MMKTILDIGKSHFENLSATNCTCKFLCYVQACGMYCILNFSASCSFMSCLRLLHLIFFLFFFFSFSTLSYYSWRQMRNVVMLRPHVLSIHKKNNKFIDSFVGLNLITIINIRINFIIFSPNRFYGMLIKFSCQILFLVTTISV